MRKIATFFSVLLVFGTVFGCYVVWDKVNSFFTTETATQSAPNHTLTVDEAYISTLVPADQLQEAPPREQIEVDTDLYLNHLDSSVFELPVVGSTGYALLYVDIYNSASSSSGVVRSVAPGAPFTILQESNDWWKIKIDQDIGWIAHRNCMINLPDVLPSIVYDNANAYDSVFTVIEQNIPNVTGRTLYNAKDYNARLEENEFIMPIGYHTAKKVASAQAIALSEGDTLIMIETFRPYDTQMQVVDAVSEVMSNDSSVRTAINSWGQDWFIAIGVSTHQQGVAMDVSLGKVTGTELRISGDYYYQVVTAEEYEMPTPIHDLNPASASMARPVSSSAWRTTALGPNMNTAGITLQNYCTTAGFTPLASEWWHFDNHNGYPDSSVTGKFFLGGTVSLPAVAG